MLKYSSPSVVHPIFENFDCNMVVVLSRLWLPLFHPGVSAAVLAQGHQTQCYKLAPQPAVPGTPGWKRSSHSCDGTTTILLSKFSKKGCTMLRDEYFSMVYHDMFLAWYAQRVEIHRHS